MHTHPQHGVAYVAKGRIECVVKAKKVLIAEQGDSFAKTYRSVPHYCKNLGDREGIIYVTNEGVKVHPVTFLLKLLLCFKNYVFVLRIIIYF